MTGIFRLYADKLAYQNSLSSITAISENFISIPADSVVKDLFSHIVDSGGGLGIVELVRLKHSGAFLRLPVKVFHHCETMNTSQITFNDTAI